MDRMTPNDAAADVGPSDTTSWRELAVARSLDPARLRAEKRVQRFLDAARLLLEREGLAVVGVATTSNDALRLEEELRTDVVLVDIRLGDESGFDLARRLSSTVIMVSTHAESEYAEQIAASPAAGFIPKAQLSGSAVLRLVGPPTD